MKKKYDFYIGIDPSRPSGWAVWGANEKAFIELETLQVHLLFERIKNHEYPRALFIIEDARKRRWFGSRAKEKLQGAGAVKALTSDIERAMEYYAYDYRMLHPQRGATKLDARTFALLSGHKGRTSEHARDAAMLVFGRK